MKKILVTMFSLAISNSYASEWWILDAGLESMAFIDISSIKSVDSGEIKIWHKVIKKDGAADTMLWFCKCDTEEIGWKSYVLHKKDGFIKSDEADIVNYNYVVPDSTGDTIFNLACSDDPISKFNLPINLKLKDDVSPEKFAEGYFERLKKNVSPKKHKMLER